MLKSTVFIPEKPGGSQTIQNERSRVGRVGEKRNRGTPWHYISAVVFVLYAGNIKKKKKTSRFLLMWRWNTETGQLKGEKSTASLNHLHQRRRNSANQHQRCVYNLFFHTLTVGVVCKMLGDGFGQCWVYVALSFFTVIMNSQLKMVSTVTTLGTKCCRPWAGRRVKVSVATSRASLHRSRYWDNFLRGFFISNISINCSITHDFPPQAQLRTKGAGLGTKGTNYTLSASDTYKDAVRKAMFARFTELEWDSSSKHASSLSTDVLFRCIFRNINS